MAETQKRSRDRGASVVEAALIAPLFLLAIFSILEMGLLFRNSLTTDNASREGARTASIKGNAADSDYYVLRTVEHGLATVGLEKLEYVVVFRASGPNSGVPAACKVGSQTDLCNRYTAADFFAELDDAAGNDTGEFRCGVGARDDAWCPTDRIASLSAGTDFIGVHVATKHKYVTGLLGIITDPAVTLGETTILRVEPDED